jgi:hypothetical protein
VRADNAIRRRTARAVEVIDSSSPFPFGVPPRRKSNYSGRLVLARSCRLPRCNNSSAIRGNPEVRGATLAPPLVTHSRPCACRPRRRTSGGTESPESVGQRSNLTVLLACRSAIAEVGGYWSTPLAAGGSAFGAAAQAMLYAQRGPLLRWPGNAIDNAAYEDARNAHPLLSRLTRHFLL